MTTRRETIKLLGCAAGAATVLPVTAWARPVLPPIEERICEFGTYKLRKPERERILAALATLDPDKGPFERDGYWNLGVHPVGATDIAIYRVTAGLIVPAGTRTSVVFMDWYQRRLIDSIRAFATDTQASYEARYRETYEKASRIWEAAFRHPAAREEPRYREKL